MTSSLRNHSLSTLRGLTAAEVARLKKLGIDSTKELLAAAPNTRAEQALAQKAGITQDRMREAVNRADLTQVPGVGPATADLFENAGVNSARELAQRNVASLNRMLAEFAVQHPELNHRLPSPTTVASLVAKAKELVANATTPATPTDPTTPTIPSVPGGATADDAAKGLQDALVAWYRDHSADVPAEGNSLDQARAAVSASKMVEVTDPNEDPHGHDLSKVQLFKHPDVVFPGSDTMWYVAFDRGSGKLLEAYDFN